METCEIKRFKDQNIYRMEENSVQDHVGQINKSLFATTNEFRSQ